MAMHSGAHLPNPIDCHLIPFTVTSRLSASQASGCGLVRMCGGDGAATIAVATTGVLSALGATLFAATAEAALRCSRQHRHYKGVD